VTDSAAPGGAPPPDAPPRRPVSIVLTLGCAFAGLADLQAAAFSFSPDIRRRLSEHSWVPGVVAALALVQIACLVTLWRGRRAGLVAYLALALVHSGVMLAARSWSACYLVPPVVVLLAGLWAWERLR
jgi:hypothetical protein